MKHFLNVDNVYITNKETGETKKIDVNEISVDLSSTKDETSESSVSFTKGCSGTFEMERSVDCE